MCDIKRGTNLANLLIETSIIIWDEALMTNKQCFEAFDRSLRDIMAEKDDHAAHIPFGGKIIVLGGDPKQILPVIENGTKQQIINASIISSYLWPHTKILFLTQNMRLQRKDLTEDEYKDLQSFNDWILNIGNGYLYQTIILKLNLTLWFTRAILATTNEIVDEINNYMVTLLPTERREYYSADTISKCVDAPNDANILYPVEYLNTLNANNFPPHKLTLKIGTPVMLLRNLNQHLGLCNGTRIMITKLGDTLLEGIIITGQTLANVGIYLKKKVFTHGQLYVAVSRVTNRKGLKILIENDDGSCGSTTKNIVYKDMDITPLSQLRPGTYTYVIIVRVSRVWEFHGRNDDEPIRHLDLVVIDQQGTAMYAEVPPDALSKLQPQLKEGKILKMRKISIDKAKPTFKPVHGLHMIRLHDRTILEDVHPEPKGFPKYAYFLTPFMQLPQLEQNKEYFIDVIGRITALSDATEITTNSGIVRMKRLIHLMDLSGNIVEISLWGSRAEEFPGQQVYEASKTNHVISIFVGTLVKTLSGARPFLSGTSACRWYINVPEIPEITAFYTSIGQESQPIQKITLENANESHNMIEQKSLLELRSIDPFDNLGAQNATHQQGLREIAIFATSKGMYALNRTTDTATNIITCGEKMTVVVKIQPSKSIDRKGANRNNKDLAFDILSIKKRHGRDLAPCVFKSEQTDTLLDAFSSQTTNLAPLVPIQSNKENDQASATHHMSPQDMDIDHNKYPGAFQLYQTAKSIYQR
ncbi:hypothetical protein U9M48_011289 [Paspalum notatum var. saurae]|uniref:ATP-dependent DNA helicase n=1 Tax=Paspalum notatum var. saurae TaxID=547442 RepID=A0AAQ3SV41_PASNO